MVIRKLILIFTIFSISMTVFASDSIYNLKIEKAPFKTCIGTGESQFSRYAGENVSIAINQNSIQIRQANKSPETYASLKSLCGVDVNSLNVVCDKQEENVGGNIYELTKDCSSQIPGTNRTLFNFHLDLTLNLKEAGGVKSATGSLSCVANRDGFRGITISTCR